MYGLERYLQQEFPDAWYSEVRYVQSVISPAGTTVALGDYLEFGATFILITGFILSFDAVVAASVMFTDQVNQPLFEIQKSPNSTGFYPIFQMIKGGTFRISANTNTNLKFSVQHQYMRNVDVKGKD